MASYYVNTDSGNDTTGDGSSGNPWASFNHADTNSAVGDIIYLDGVAEDTLSATNSTVGKLFIQNPASAQKTYTLRVDSFTVQLKLNTFQSINFKLTGSPSFMFAATLDEDQSGNINNCSIITTGAPSKTKLATIIISFASTFERGVAPLFFNCDIDCTNLSSFWNQSNTNTCPNFINCTIKNYDESLTSNYMLPVNRPFIFMNNKLYNNAGTIFKQSESASNFSGSSIYNNTFLGDSNLTIIDTAAYTDTKLSFLSNLVCSSSGNINLFSSNTVTILGLLGNNCFYNTTYSLNYSNFVDFVDYVDSSFNLKSTNPLDSDFLEPTATSLAKGNNIFNPNADIGAVQGTASVLFPTADQVLDGVSFGNGVAGDRTGNLTLPTINQVESGVQFGAAGTEFTGTLVVETPTAGDLREGVTVAGVLGTLKVPLTTQVESGIEFDSDGSIGTLVKKLVQPGKVPLVVYTSDGSNINGEFGSSQTFYITNGANVDTLLATLGVAERYANGDATAIVDNENDLLISLRLDR